MRQVKGQITQKQAAGQLRVTERQVRRLMKQIRNRGDVAVVHGSRGRASNRRSDSETERRAIEELRRANCHDFWPTFAAEHISRVLGVKVGRDTMRKWMIAAGLWRSRKRKVEAIHQWRERRYSAPTPSFIETRAIAYEAQRSVARTSAL